jgi:hypothetical protein
MPIAPSRSPYALALLAAGALLLSGCGGFGWDDTDNSPRSTFEATFSEPVDTTLTGEAFLGEAANGSGDPSDGAIGLITQGTADQSFLVFDNPATDDAPAAGSYDLAQADSADNAGFDAVVASFGLVPSQRIGGSFSGTLQVDEESSNSVAGSFDMRAFVLYNNSSRVDTVTVTGTFDAVATSGGLPSITTPSPSSSGASAGPHSPPSPRLP